jgi:flagellar hook-basal body complex protein FliE
MTMALPITPINPITTPSLIGSIEKVVTQPAGTSFQSVLSNAIQNVESSGATADAAMKDFLSGGTHELHSTVLAAQSAELDFDLFTQVRNKIVSAYEEIMKMQL